MSVMKADGSRVVLPRLETDELWDTLREHYAAENQRRWKALAILALRENAGWPLDAIGSAFGHHRGHVSRVLLKTKADLRDRFERSPEWMFQSDPELEQAAGSDLESHGNNEAQHNAY